MKPLREVEKFHDSAATSMPLAERRVLLQEYYGDVVRYLNVFEINRAYVEDAVQDTMVEALICIGNIRDISKLKFWLLTIAKRVGIKYVNFGICEELHNYSYDQMITERRREPGVLTELNRNEALSCLEKEELLKDFERTLKSKEQKVFILHNVYEYKLREIAQIMGETETNTRTLSARARKKLRVMLSENNLKR